MIKAPAINTAMPRLPAIAAVESDTPPLRLVLGKYANDKLRKKLADAEKERAVWEHTGLPTDFTPTL